MSRHRFKPDSTRTNRRPGTPVDRLYTKVLPETYDWLCSLAKKHGHRNLGRALDELRESSTRNNAAQTRQTIDSAADTPQDAG